MIVGATLSDIIETQRRAAERQVFYRNTADEVFLNDAFQVFLIALSVPSSFRVHEGDRAVDTDAQTFGFGAEDAAFYVDEPQLFESRF